MKLRPNLTAITDDCVARLRRGESIADCLARYPEIADQLAPMLSAAEQLVAFSHVGLTGQQRMRAKAVLRGELAGKGIRIREDRRLPDAVSGPRLRIAPLAALLAVLLFASVAFTAVAASQPGDLVYPVRVAVERAPAWLQPSPALQAAAELAAADRRLSDLAHDAARHAVAIEALLRSDQAALERTAMLDDEERQAVAARVAAHAEVLRQLAERDSNPETVARLHSAVAAVLALTGQPELTVITPDPTATITPSPAPSFAAVVPTVVPILTLAPPTVTSVPATASPLPAMLAPVETPVTPLATIARPTRGSIPTVAAPGQVKPRPSKTPRIELPQDGKPAAKPTLIRTPPGEDRRAEPTAGAVRPTSTRKPDPPRSDPPRPDPPRPDPPRPDPSPQPQRPEPGPLESNPPRPDPPRAEPPQSQRPPEPPRPTREAP